MDTNTYRVTYAAVPGQTERTEDFQANGMAVNTEGALTLVDTQATVLVFVARGFWRSCALIEE